LLAQQDRLAPRAFAGCIKMTPAHPSPPLPLLLDRLSWQIVYISDAQANQRLGGEPATPAERAAQTARIKDMKAALTVTNFSLGDEVPVYASVNREAMDLAIKFKGVGRVKMAEDVMNAVKASSLHFGNEPINWESCNMAAFGPKASTNNFQKLKEDTMVLTAALRKHNFSFGEEPIEYISDQTRGYGSVPLGAYRQRIDALPKIKETIQDSRSCHFSLGLDKVRYESIAQEGLRQGYGEGAAADVKAGLERAAKMKADLCRTSIIIGDDAEYM